MADVHSKAVRSYNMSKICSKDTKPELLVRKFLFSKGFRYRLHLRDLPGKPDIVLPKYKIAIFVNGCFWHGHESCKYYVIPKSNTEWWLNKIKGNKTRDKENIYKLNAEGWKTIVIFECELKSSKVNESLNSLLDELH
ncbi:MAG TPA: DNA mismatch endonuclease Vsr [Prolixibacteraceae bacterium]|jgi:DNA mismatch endonuclease (patch repair protein)|nr:DNA mismatch endonuclease Vsr [Prolixibacteraceae bacterium]